jgi:hypothetical protein
MWRYGGNSLTRVAAIFHFWNKTRAKPALDSSEALKRVESPNDVILRTHPARDSTNALLMFVSVTHATSVSLNENNLTP